MNWSRICFRKNVLNRLSAKRELLSLSFKEDGDPSQHLSMFEALPELFV